MKEIYDFLTENKITPNGLFVLHSLLYKYNYINYINVSMEQYRLELSKFIEKKENGEFIITHKGLLLLQEYNTLLTKKQKKEKVKIGSSWDNNIIKYNELFPKGKKIGTSISFRTNPKDLFDSFTWFFKTYPEYNWDQVLNATSKYLQTFEELGDYTYLQTSRYFINKQDKSKNIISNLATMCYNIMEGNDIETDTGHYYFE